MKCFYCEKEAETVLNGESMCDGCISTYGKILLGIFIMAILIIYLSNK